jgi:outer membrane murein-binding lipoprotein Lpp
LKREEVTFVMKKLVVLPLVAALMILPLTGCESKKLKEENASLKQQVDSLTQEKNGLAAKADELSKANADLQAKVGDLEKKVEELSKPKPAAKAPAKKTTTKKR